MLAPVDFRIVLIIRAALVVALIVGQAFVAIIIINYTARNKKKIINDQKIQ